MRLSLRDWQDGQGEMSDNPWGLSDTPWELRGQFRLTCLWVPGDQSDGERENGWAFQGRLQRVERKGPQDITKGNNRRQDEQPRERTQEKGGKGKTFTIGLVHSVEYVQRYSYFSKKSRKMKSWVPARSVRVRVCCHGLEGSRCGEQGRATLESSQFWTGSEGAEWEYRRRWWISEWRRS